MSNSSDDVIWKIINEQFCSFKVTTPQKESFCKNEYNVTGVCSRATCPLANARYATIRSVDGKLYLYMKTAERIHTPSRWWERIKLSKNYEKALEQVDQHLLYWPEHLIDKCKQRLTRLTQVAIAERRLALKESERKYSSVAPKVKRREKTRERKALVAAKLERAIEKELLDRLKSGAYGDKPLNVDEQIWNKVLKGVEADGEEQQNQEDEEESESEAEVEYVEDDDEDEEVDMEDLEKWLDAGSDNSASEGSDDSEDSENEENNAGKRRGDGSGPKAKKPRGHVEIEYEQEPAVQV